MFDSIFTNVIMTKLILRNDVSSEWENSDIVLEKGEPALEIDADKKVAKIKIGDGYHVFNDLPYSTLTPDEIQDMIDKAAFNAGSIQSVSLDSGTNNGTLKLTVNNTVYDNISVTGLGTAAFTDASDYATSEQGRRADEAMSLKGTVGATDATVETLPDENVSIGDSYKSISDFVIPAEKSFSGADISVVSGDIVVAMPNTKWLVISTGSVETAKSLTEGISAEITGGVVGSAVSSANAGETMTIEVKEINTDYLTTGSKVLVISGGSSDPL